MPRAGERLETRAAAELPATLASRAYGPALVIAIAAHLLLVGLALLPASAPPVEEAPVRLVFVEPPPPPAAPLGAPSGAGTAAMQPDSAPEPAPVALEPEPPKPVEPEPDRLRRADADKKKKPDQPKPRRKPQPAAAKPVEAAPAPAPPADVAPGIASGAVGGQAGGVAGGVAGGIAGGVVGGTGSGPVPVGQVANPPSLVHRVAPVYPDEARRRDVEGLVVVEAVLDRDGRIESDSVKIIRSIALLDDAALAAVRQWRFRPARDDQGRSLRVILEVPIRFVLR
jgi:periplasmic protein TonB